MSKQNRHRTSWVVFIFFTLLATSTALLADDSDDWYSWYKDADSDGVANRDDDCPGTGVGIEVGSDGCPVISSTDSDNDGVWDMNDDCPYTPPGATVNTNGCPSDTDYDGVYDGLDMCPGTPMGAPTDAMGCPTSLDSDNDGVPDSADLCPGHYDNIDIDMDGIPDGCDPLIDNDGDGVANDFDKCWTTPAGSPVDADGCAAGETPPTNPNPTPPPAPTPPPPATDPAVCPPGQSSMGGNLSIFGECVTPDDCKACHGHAERFPILNRSIADSHPQHADRNADCLSCHDVSAIASGEGGFSSVDGCLAACHLDLINLPTNPQGLPLTVVGSPESGTNRHHYTDTFNNESCHACHVLPETQLTSSEICITCHDGSVTQKDVTLAFNQTSAHPLDVLGRVAGNGEQVSCLDCHNPNQVTSSNLLKGVEGVEPTWPGNWMPVTNFTPTLVEQQYQLCLKCHSYNKFGNNPPTDIFGNQMTDQAIEFNPNNTSGHRVAANAGTPWNDFKMGPSSNPTAVDYSGYLLNGLMPDSILKCGQCHNDANDPNDQAPHGSPEWPILGGPWDGRTNAMSGNALCFQCHDNTVFQASSLNNWQMTGFSDYYNGSHKENLHAYHVGKKGHPCQACHAGIPHGWKRKALLIHGVVQPDMAPYNQHNKYPYDGSGYYGIPSDVRQSMGGATGVDNVESGYWKQEVCHDYPSEPTGSCN